MSELNSGKIKITNDGNIIMQFSNYHHIIDSDTELYYKHQADKVIADLEESHKKEVGQLLILNREQANAANRLRDSMEQVIRHHKYKRCLDNAEICCEKKENCYNRALRKYSKDEADYLVRKSDFWQDWEFRWLKIVEKFKEAK